MIILIDPGSDMFENEYIDAIINTTNTTGVMGGGIALKMRELFPEPCNEYNKRCLNKELQGGDVVIQNVSKYQHQHVEWLIQFATKHHVMYDAKIEYIKRGLPQLVKLIEDYKIKSIAIPPLGCGLGGLDWKDVKPLILDAVRDLNCVIYVYEQ